MGLQVKFKLEPIPVFNPICGGIENIHKLCGEGGVQHQPLLNTQNHNEEPKFFQTGHIEIGKVMKFGCVWRPFWGS